MQVPKVPSLWWSIAACYGLLAFAGAVFGFIYSDRSLIVDVLTGVAMLTILGSMGFVAPLIEGDLGSWVFILSAFTGLIVARLKLTGWVRWITVVALLICINAYGFYLAARAGA
jgi:hypothetical protein